MTTIRHDYSVILRFTNSTPEMLIVTTNMGDTLPMCENPNHFWQSTEIVNQAIQEKFGLQITTMRYLRVMTATGDNQPVISVYLQLYLSGELADNLRWVAIDALPDLQLPPVINHVQQWVDWLQSEHPERKSWYRADGIQETFKAVQAKFSVQPQQVRTWERSAVWRIPTEEGKCYLKDIPPMFAFERDLTQWLYQRFPEHSTPMLAWANPNQLLMADYGGESLAPHMDLEVYETALSTYVKLQTDLVEDVETLKKLGVPHRSVGWMADNLEAFLADDANFTRGIFPLTIEQITIIRDALPRLKRACDVLSDCPIPETLEHGDLWIGQIIIRDNQPIFTDWSDSAITFPLFSLPYFLAEKGDFPDVAQASNRISSAYLDGWLHYVNRQIINELMPHVNLLSPLYTVLRYHHDILPQMEIQWEMENMVAYNLRLLLKALAD